MRPLGLFQRLQHAFYRRTEHLHHQGVRSLKDVTPLFECKLPWNARWTLPLMGMQLTISIVGAELILNHWTERAVPPTAAGTPASPTADADSDTAPEFVLRPLYQRIPLAAGQALVGGFLCVVLLNSRARVVRRAFVLPVSALDRAAPLAPRLPKSADRVLVLQNAWQLRGQGRVLPLAAVKLKNDRAPNELRLVADGVRGSFVLPVDEGRVNGGPTLSGRALKEALFCAWYGRKRGLKEFSGGEWVSGLTS